MLFNSFAFLIFFLGVTLFYYLINYKWRVVFLLLASCYFYAFLIPAYLLVLFLIILIDFTAGIMIESSQGMRRKFFLGLSIISNLSVLAIFKYHDFFVENLNFLSGQFFSNNHFFSLWKIALPVGLSFHTFQAMSYNIEVYRANQKAERKISIFALYVMFYPQLVAGPIERPDKLIPQFYQKLPINFDAIANGLKLMAWGFFMKVVVADRLGIFVDHIYKNPAVHSKWALITATSFYSFQIYCDFAGYSFIAIGSALVMGFQLSPNFRRPYLATSLQEFWHRWNITLSQWFRDYVYIPMGGNRVEKSKFVFNILVVFILSGLWHGAKWTFIIWGFLHGMLLLAERIPIKKTISFLMPKPILIVITFLMVSFCWIFFRAESFQDSITIIKRIFSMGTAASVQGEFEERALLLYSLLGIGTVVLADMQKEFFPSKFQLLNHPKDWVRMTTCIGLVIIILLFGVFDGSQFIYFQF